MAALKTFISVFVLICLIALLTTIGVTLVHLAIAFWVVALFAGLRWGEP